MDSQASNQVLVHSYDVERRTIRCGTSAQAPSTKHDRAVTCAECLRLLASSKDESRRRD